MTPFVLKDLLLVLCGGLFGWILGKFPVKWVYVVMAVTLVLIILVVK